MQVNEDLIRNVVAQVLSEIGPPPAVNGKKYAGRYGIFSDVDEAVAAAREAFEQLSERTIDIDKRLVRLEAMVEVAQRNRLPDDS